VRALAMELETATVPEDRPKYTVLRGMSVAAQHETCSGIYIDHIAMMQAALSGSE
jgi:hypothetical protein